MLINKDIVIEGKNIVLVPYRKEHVLKYHEWMKSPELQQLTASEPLTLEQEFQMQISWQNDPDKCTFIILEKSTYDNTNDEIEAMIGDTNLFFIDNNRPHLAEAEIMIAESSARGKRRGWEATLLILRYGFQELGIEQYEVKISVDNNKSLNMFKKLKFEEINRNSVFQEVAMVRNVDENWKEWIISESTVYDIKHI